MKIFEGRAAMVTGAKKTYIAALCGLSHRVDYAVAA